MTLAAALLLLAACPAEAQVAPPSTAREDSMAAVVADIRALPGTTGFGLYALEADGPRAIAAHDPDANAPIGSAFKLWVLVEAIRQVASGRRRWTDVVPVGRPSLASGILQAWPRATPVTLQTLATLMVSISDNTATDTLMAALGRTNVDGAVAATGATARIPLMTTREAFVVKGNAALTRAWAAADAAGRRRMLSDHAASIDAARIDPAMFSGKPVATDSVEWFASPADMAHVLDWLRQRGGTTALAILGINSGADPAVAARLDYVGFKGGSEPGVLSLNYLVRDKTGRWYAITGNWHRTDQAVSEPMFVAMMMRAMTLIAAR